MKSNAEGMKLKNKINLKKEFKAKQIANTKIDAIQTNITYITYLIFGTANAKPETEREEGEEKIVNRSHTVTLLSTRAPPLRNKVVNSIPFRPE